MFNSVQIKHECMGIEDVNSGDKINAPTNSKYSTFSQENVDYKYNELSQFWNHTQLSNEIHPKNEIHGQYNLFQTEENNCLAYMKNCVQNNTIFQVNQGESLNQMNQQCHIDMPQKAEQLQFSQNIQPAKFTSQIVTISEPISSIKSNRPGRPPKSSSEANIRRKLKCQCEICFKEFGHKSNLFIHMRTHNGERPYKCNQCEKCFTHSGNLAIHMRTHSGERPYGCQICGKMFSHSGNLSTHLRTHSGIKPYKCAVCGKEFRHSGNLSIHERIHSGIKPFQCKVCGKDFYHSGNLTTHMKKHIVNINTSINQCENNEKQTVSGAVNINDTPPISSFNNLPLTQTTDVKLMPSVNNIVPIKNESNDDELTNTVGILTSTTN
ncbi:Zinc finger protein 33A [Eufriesea mexicana]|uniref:Zinc finger protein 33A n=1 Tax=Eufriesea mexicana TaxID=516756 RepID=A0A310SR30_9HYME|nr:PREDICTED: zinc finger protein 836-like [Eufriesea mexicana]OAD62116.1 Zinc finger protein 33A [Eufriesea mexicana]